MLHKKREEVNKAAKVRERCKIKVQENG